MVTKLDRMKKTREHLGNAKASENKKGGYGGRGSSAISAVPNGNISAAPPTVWSSMTSKDLATPDAYGGVGSGTMGTMTGRHKLDGGGSGKGSGSLLGGGANAGFAGSLSGLKDAGKAIKQGMDFYKQVERAAMSGGSTIDRIANVLGVGSSGLASMIGTGGALSTFIGGTDQLKGLSENLKKASEITMKIGNEAKRLSKVDWSDLNQVSSLLNQVGQSLGGSKIAWLEDTSAKALFAADIVNRMSKLKIPGAVEKVAKLFGKDPKGLHLFSKHVSKESLNSSDLRGLEAVLESIGSGKFRSNEPNFIQDLTSKFKYSSIQETRNKEELFKILFDLLKKAADGTDSFMYRKSTGQYALNGRYTSSGGVEDKHINLAPFMGGSTDFKDLLKTGGKAHSEPAIKCIMMSVVIPKRGLREYMKKNLPYALVTENVTLVNDVKAPTNLSPVNVPHKRKKKGISLFTIRSVSSEDRG